MSAVPDGGCSDSCPGASSALIPVPQLRQVSPSLSHWVTRDIHSSGMKDSCCLQPTCCGAEQTQWKAQSQDKFEASVVQGSCHSCLSSSRVSWSLSVPDSLGRTRAWIDEEYCGFCGKAMPQKAAAHALRDVQSRVICHIGDTQ